MNTPMVDMTMMNMPMVNMPMMQMPMSEVDDNKDLKMMYPEIYIKLYPMVSHHCDMMVARYGTMYCPSMDEMDYISEQICDKYEENYRCSYEYDDYDNEYDDLISDNDMRQRRRRRRRPGRRNTTRDLIKVLLIGGLIGRRGGLPFYNYGY
jgi:hypothetical protein